MFNYQDSFNDERLPKGEEDEREYIYKNLELRG